MRNGIGNGLTLSVPYLLTKVDYGNGTIGVDCLKMKNTSVNIRKIQRRSKIAVVLF